MPTGDNLAGASNLAYTGSTVAFNGTDTLGDSELWTSDGTASGTMRVKDINPSGSSSPNYLVHNGTDLYFVATDPVNGQEVWKSDGTTAGTNIVKDIVSGSGSSFARTLFAASNGHVYFSATNGTSGNELWKTDGTSAGTVMLKDIRSGSASSFPSKFVQIGSKVYFTANSGAGYTWWRTDGTSAGTVSVSAGITNISDYIVMGNALLFTARTAAIGYELFKHDTATTTSALLKDIYAGTASSNASHFEEVNGVIYFAATDGISGFEIWKTDGNAAGTLPAIELTAGASGSSINDLLNVNNRLIILKGNKTILDSDGTLAGTVTVPHLYPEDASPDVFNLYENNGKLLIVGETYLYGREVYCYSPIGSTPVNWLGAEVKWHFNHGLVEWHTTSEENLAVYEVKRMLSTEFETIGKVHPSGKTATDVNAYSYLDMSIPENVNTIYYRIMQIDNDGTSSSSEVLVLNRELAVRFSTSPNPGSDFVNIRTSLEYENGWISISDLQGKVLHKEKVRLGGNLLNTGDLGNGNYLISITGVDGRVLSRKWTKF